MALQRAGAGRFGQGRASFARSLAAQRRAFSVFQLIEGRRFLEMTSQISEFIVPPNLLQAESSAFSLIPGVIEVQRSGILAEFRGL
jgi:hypothetical protein